MKHGYAHTATNGDQGIDPQSAALVEVDEVDSTSADGRFGLRFMARIADLEQAMAAGRRARRKTGASA